ncbi:hypothetical protein [Caballeronia catudaia]|uniref:hypothetical protein n=1 Tax=Caballeronia catudaia TaxID=1777136 RepID=UPI0011805866|nr:hypothetical protein [Caballeronia catudaia]
MDAVHFYAEFNGIVSVHMHDPDTFYGIGHRRPLACCPKRLARKAYLTPLFSGSRALPLLRRNKRETPTYGADEPTLVPFPEPDIAQFAITTDPDLSISAYAYTQPKPIDQHSRVVCSKLHRRGDPWVIRKVPNVEVGIGPSKTRKSFQPWRTKTSTSRLAVGKAATAIFTASSLIVGVEQASDGRASNAREGRTGGGGS